ncbi:helix-turn-helix transcriptional regulator [Mucilaginibacter daejeonensis]|uniref:helix-turn-helix domain-containing protein n=1 Tax=Mucilaginibacter daejeonensis TaxID=398049 RepID=UPI001D17B65C|nr:helix-turn-helix domain-containing protein [Mucilaginibacter daejeonensis]UEG52540.1 helix-turn-helix transcriptional regulator [Mucilaginibacter daejeonensis]
MPDKRPDNFFGVIERNIRQQAKALGITLSDLAKHIEMTEAGFYKMLSTESIKVKTLRKISQVLKQPIPFFFDDHSSGSVPYRLPEHLTQVAEPSEGYYNERESLKKQISLLESQLKDKELIIELLNRK